MYQMFEGVRPFDWLMLGIELAVLLVIVCAELKSHLRDKRLASRAKLIADRRIALSEFVAKGLELQRIVPVGTVWTALEAERKTAWQKAATAWIEETQAFLERHSPRAATAFIVVSGFATDDFMVMNSSGQMALLHDSVRYFYQRVMSHLSNLHGIIEMADTYF